MALFYGATVLDESLTLTDLAGLALILLGVTLGTGVVQARRRARLERGSVTSATSRSLLRAGPIWGASYLFIKVGGRATSSRRR